MKRGMFVLLTALICLTIGMACAENDYAAYELQWGDAFAVQAPDAILDNGDMLFRAWADREGTVDETHPWHLVWMRDGKIYRDVAYRNNTRYPWSVSRFAVSRDNECYVILPAAEDVNGAKAVDPGYVQGAEVYHWTENGLERTAVLPGLWRDTDIRVIRGGFALWDRQSGRMTVHTCDGTLTAEYPLETYEDGDFVSFAGEMDGVQLAVFRTSRYQGAKVTSRVYAVRDGKILWQKDYRVMTYAHVPGDGYLYVSWYDNGKSYSSVHFDRLDESGRVLLGRTISADKQVLVCALRTDPQKGRLQLYGRGVSRSREEYNAFVMTLDETMRESALQVCTFNYHRDTEFSVMPLPEGGFAVFSNGTYWDDAEREPGEKMPASGMPVVVPMEVLQETNRHGITLK